MCDSSTEVTFKSLALIVQKFPQCTKCPNLVIPRCCHRCRNFCLTNRICWNCKSKFACYRCGIFKEKETTEHGEFEVCEVCEVILRKAKKNKIG